MLSKALEKTLHAALGLASKQQHEYATLEHLLLALLDDHDAAAVLRACRVSLDRLRTDLAGFIERDLIGLITQTSGDPKPTTGFQRVVQRAANQVRSADRDEEATGAHVLLALFSESESHTVYFMQQRGLTETAARTAVAQRIPAPAQAWIFVALPPGPEAEDIRMRSIVPAISAAGHRAEYPGSGLVEGITASILAQVRRSRLVIADCSTTDGEVQFVAGLAVGLGIPVIPIGHADHRFRLNPQDTRYHDILIWQTPEELAEALEERIAVVLGRAPDGAGDSVGEIAESELLEATSAAVQRLLGLGKARGYVTYDELNAALPADQVSAEMIEDTMAMLHDMDINVVEGGEHGPDGS